MVEKNGFQRRRTAWVSLLTMDLNTTWWHPTSLTLPTKPLLVSRTLFTVNYIRTGYFRFPSWYEVGGRQSVESRPNCETRGPTTTHETRECNGKRRVTETRCLESDSSLTPDTDNESSKGRGSGRKDRFRQDGRVQDVLPVVLKNILRLRDDL